MPKEWFTIAELRAAEIPSLDEGVFSHWAENFEELSPEYARWRETVTPRGKTLRLMEFRFDLLLLAERVALERFNRDQIIDGQIAELEGMLDARNRHLAP